MKYFVIFAAFFLAINAESSQSATDKNCYTTVMEKCGPSNEKKNMSLPECTSKYGGFEARMKDLQKFANAHITRSMEFLLMSTHFSNYEMNREGFAKLFRKLSDETWADSINIIKYIAKRGGSYDYHQRANDVNSWTGSNNEIVYQAYELQAMSMALEMYKQLANQSFEIHKLAIHNKDHDTEIAHYIEEEFSEKHADHIRALSGHVSDISKMITDTNKFVFLHLFDEYLEKSL